MRPDYGRKIRAFLWCEILEFRPPEYLSGPYATFLFCSAAQANFVGTAALSLLTSGLERGDPGQSPGQFLLPLLEPLFERQ